LLILCDLRLTVRQPVFCCNNHVFCSNCIKVWLEKSSQCPICRVAITPENPCREIIGATTDCESSESHSVKRRLRKTRGELLLREYEVDEELKSKNLSLEMQLKTAVEPSTVLVPQSETSSVDPSALEESANKLRAANDLYRKVKQDLERLKEFGWRRAVSVPSVEWPSPQKTPAEKSLVMSTDLTIIYC
uniref:RING-type domain-containing protein n=1 Tax=Sinocyclocheilus grahami TaxID=75366 RepID=A0A672MYQ2_SINGR